VASRGAADNSVSATYADPIRIADIGRDIIASVEHYQEGYRFGRSVGFDEGFVAGEAAAASRTTAAYTGCTGVWNAPTQARLAELRNDPPITTPCAHDCGWCVVCVRHRQWLRVQTGPLVPVVAS
jgi:hypothetical protein